MLILPVLLAGGSGTRLWPLSRQDKPKQFIRFGNGYSLLQQAALRFVEHGCLPPVVVCNEQHRFMVAQQLLEIGVTASAIILEPSAKNTAPAALLAGLWAQQHHPSASLFFAPADHAIENFTPMGEQLAQLHEHACSHLIVFGITPTHAETGFGYIHCETTPQSHDCNLIKVCAFTEKPDSQRAQEYLAHGNYLWNSGMLMAGVEHFLQRLKHYQPSMYIQVSEAAQFQPDLDFIRIVSDTWNALEGESLDYALLEHDSSLLVMPASLNWFDLGSYEQLYRYHEANEDGNVVLADAVLQHSTNNFIYAQDNHVVATLGLENTVVVHSADTTLIAARESLHLLPDLLDNVGKQYPERREFHNKTFRPWGHYQVLNEGDNFKVKRIVLNAKGRLSLQAHQHRSEHWVVVSGEVEVTVEQHQHPLRSGQSIYIEAGQKHRLCNTGKAPAVIIEVQNGAYLGEDDIERFDDDYGR
ncbi:mannose-1-phosphate guanylyltransferase/mannose-6-phosphate isomerase [Pseudoalteromonas sp. SSDWG2]|uniref:mannose-1-phosphate guanylyltransferase/mannose-6-phosphate isomerase n=1 Tax=Pseudoalteromonas sp. SSDWG2 TaxID=3139391 RepID=UPI003BAC4879